MKIHKLWAENVRGITDHLPLELSPTGLNLITAPNEMGKSTMAEILNYLFTWKSSSLHQAIFDLKPYGKDVGPLMGAIIEVGGQIYKIEKQWLKDKKTEVELISPEKKALSGNAADSVINEIFTGHLDETIWKMIQVAQADFTALVGVEFTEDRRLALSDYLAEAVTDTESYDDSTLVQKVADQYLDWWTPAGQPAKGQKTSGRLIADKESELEKLKKDALELKEKIADATSIKEAMIENRESREVLQNRKQAQDVNKELVFALRELKIRTDAQEKIDQILASNPAIKGFSQELFDDISDDHVLYAQYNALSSLKLTGLADTSVEINGVLLSIAKGEVLEQKLASPLKIAIPDLLSIDYASDATGAVDLSEGAKRYENNLEKLGCENFQVAQTLSRQYRDFRELNQNLKAILDVHTVEHLQSVISKCEAIKAVLPNWDFDINASPVSTTDLEVAAQQVGQKEGRNEEISRFGWHSSLEETIEKISDREKRIRSLKRKADASKMLYKKLEKHKEAAEKDYSLYFAKYINDLAKSFYGKDVHFEVSDAFEILSRRMDSVEINVADLSTGAKEQLAILIRLALTKIVQVGEPFPVILDDEFAHSDPDRIAMMSNVFSDFGKDQQFIMFTCTPEKFTSYKPAKTIDLAALRGA